MSCGGLLATAPSVYAGHPGLGLGSKTNDGMAGAGSRGVRASLELQEIPRTVS